MTVRERRREGLRRIRGLIMQLGTALLMVTVLLFWTIISELHRSPPTPEIEIIYVTPTEVRLTAVRVYSTGVNGIAPQWSSDGERILFYGVDWWTGAFVMDAGGTNVQHIGEGYVGNTEGWLPDGRRGYDYGPYIFTNNFYGTDERRLASGSSPDWSPDGSEIVITGFWATGLYIIPSDSVYRPSSFQEGRLLVGNINRLAPRSPRWSPDGEQIVFYTFSGNYGAEIYVVNVRSGNVRHVTSGQNPDWSPDGEYIVYMYEEFFRDQLRAIRIDGTDMVILARETSARYREPCNALSDPRWSPAGNQIAFHDFHYICMVEVSGW